MEQQQPPPPLTIHEKIALSGSIIAVPLFFVIANPMALDLGACGALSSVLCTVCLAGTPTRTEGSIIGDIESSLEQIQGRISQRYNEVMTRFASSLDRTKE